ncbi:Pro-Pol polyprotein, partial [Araneus ventricosus]
MFKNVTKVDLLAVLHEIGETASENLKVVELRDILLKSREYAKDKDFIADFLATTVAQRKEEEELNRLRLTQQIESNNTTHSVENIQSLDKLLKAVQTLSISVPKKDETWNLFFDSIERAFKHKNVPEIYKSEILLKLIGEKAANILVYIDENDLKDYDKIKSLIIKEYEPSPFVCLDNFKKTKRLAGETHQQFASRLRSGWLHYCKIRKVNDFDSLVNLIISDKIFETLDNEISAHIAVRQGENWLQPNDLAKQCDIYFIAKGRSFEEIKHEKRSVYREPVYENTKYIPPPLRKPQYTNDNKYASKIRECYICSSNSHLAKNCPNRRNKYEQVNKPSNEVQRKSRNNPQALVNKPSDNSAIVTNVNSKHLQSAKNMNEINLYPLQKVSICIASRQIDAIIDSGAEISILNTALIPDVEIEEKGKIILESAFKERVEAKLAVLPVHYKNPDDCLFYSSNILFALTDKLNIPCLITPDVYNSLTRIPRNEDSPKVENILGSECNSALEIQMGEGKNENASRSDEGSVLHSQQNESGPNFSICLISESDKLPSSNDEFSESNKFRKLQRECLTLKNAFKDASLKRNNFFLRDELLFHKDKICGDTVYQLVLPKSYRDKVLQLAHNENHLGMRKTRERIKLSFYWPNVSKDVENYCRTCEKCQLKSPERQSDKIPITPVVRAPYPFHTVNVDLVGEIVPPSGRRHKYCLCLIDQNSRWPEVVPLKNLSAKTTCDALLEIFTRTGIPEIICTDQGTNFTSQLTKEFEDRLGVSPRFSTPSCPASNGLVEKWNRVFK